MTIEKRLFLKSMAFSALITFFLMIIAYLPLWEILDEKEKSIFPLYGSISSIIIFCILTAIFYFDVRRILEKKSP
jgi:Na+/melibiose symporter-like transporter